MAEQVQRKYGSVRRFGSKYGRKVRDKVGKVESELKKDHKCPVCNMLKVKRVSAGIWQCKKCNAKFAGRAYTPFTDTKSTEENLAENKA